MKNYNIQMLIQNEQNDENIPRKLKELLFFTKCFHLQRKKDQNLKNKNYTFRDHHKVYSFSLFSDRMLQEEDKKNLKSNQRVFESLSRTLKIACSMDLVNPKVAVGKSILGSLQLLILFEEENMEKVMDYSSNLVMNKEQYYELFQFYEWNVLDKYDLYQIYYLINKLDDYEHIMEYLIFSKEIFNDLSQKEMFGFLSNKFDQNGFHEHNYLLLGNDCDCLFFNEQDFFQMKYKNIIKELDEFTLHPEEKTKHICDSDKRGKYEFCSKNFGTFEFELLSDFFDEKEKQKLLSKKRYGWCHENALFMITNLTEEMKSSAYIVGGKVKSNETDFCFHSWVEIEKENLVMDYNHNLIMNRDKYYQLFEAVPISKTTEQEMTQIIKILFLQADLELHPIYLNYFGKEIARDLLKNVKVLKKFE